MRAAYIYAAPATNTGPDSENFQTASLCQTRCLLQLSERVTGRKTRGLQTEEIACKCQTFLSLLSGRRKQTSDIFSFCIQI